MTATRALLGACLLLALTGCAMPRPATPVRSDVPASSPAAAVASAPQELRAADAAALRTPAQVLRVWVAPWEDAHGDLHGAAYVYTEVEGRRWLLGEPAPRTTSPLLTPLQVERREARPPTAPAPDAARAPPRAAEPAKPPALH
jgi:conjugal transfer pilus assembly protein TraV